MTGAEGRTDAPVPPLRVLIVVDSYLPYVSGVTVSTETLARGLGARGHRVLLAAPRPRPGTVPGTAGAPGPEPEYLWLPSYAVPEPAPKDYRMPAPLPGPATVRAAARFAPDVVHVQAPFVAGRLGRFLARRTGARLVLTHHTRHRAYGHYLWIFSGLGMLLVDDMTTRFWRSCDAVIAPSASFAREIEARLGGDGPPVVPIPTGLDLSAIDRITPADLRGRHGWPADAVVAVSLGRLGKEKSVDVVLDAFAHAHARVGSLRLLVVGGGPLEDELRARAAQPDLADRVAFAGPLPRGDALAALKGADLFVFASQTETQGLVLAEALACGVPVVALDGPGVRDSTQDGVDSLVVEAGSSGRASALGDALAALGGDAPRRARLAAAARASAERHGVDARLSSVERLYAQLLAGGAVRMPQRAT